MIKKFRGDLVNLFDKFHENNDVVLKYIYHCNAQSPTGSLFIFYFLFFIFLFFIFLFFYFLFFIFYFLFFYFFIFYFYLFFIFYFLKKKR